MCHEKTSFSYDRPISDEDILTVINFYHSLDGQKVPVDFVVGVFDAITDSNSPQPIVLVTLVDLYYRKINDLVGVKYPWVSLPFSALDYKSGERLMSPEMGPFHGVFAMFSLAQRNLGILRNFLSEFGVDFITFHDCGCIMPDRDDDVMNTENYKSINLVRSHYEALGGAVRVLSFDQLEWLSPWLDMGLEEIQAYQRMTECLLTLNSDSEIYHSEEYIQNAMNKVMPILDMATV